MKPPFELSSSTRADLRFTGRRPVIEYRRSPPAPRGQEALAASFLAAGRIVLASALRRDPRERRRILVHEVFHFVWRRLGNPRRRSWGELLSAEFRSRARGELGWSAEWRKNRVRERDIQGGTRRWRDYVCEAFCDTAAFLYGGTGRHAEFTLSKRWRNLRRAWFVQWIEGRELRL
jgi:hypothetical protein